ncbi:MAG: hypothetical protein AAFY63_03350, partial [Cyanobacteria bacterium J06643_13]
CDPNKIEPVSLEQLTRESLSQPVYDGSSISAAPRFKRDDSREDTPKIFFTDILEEANRARKKVSKRQNIDRLKEGVRQISKGLKEKKTLVEVIENIDYKKIKNVKPRLTPVDIAMLLAEADSLGCAGSQPESIQACKERLKPMHQKIQESLMQAYEDSTDKASEWLRISEEMIKQAYGVNY